MAVPPPSRVPITLVPEWSPLNFYVVVCVCVLSVSYVLCVSSVVCVCVLYV